MENENSYSLFSKGYTFAKKKSRLILYAFLVKSAVVLSAMSLYSINKSNAEKLNLNSVCVPDDTTTRPAYLDSIIEKQYNLYNLKK